MTPGTAAWQLAFELSPIVLTGGIASAIPGGALPIIAITEVFQLIGDSLTGAGPLDNNAYFAHYTPLPGSTIADNQIGNYPFANSSVAANAIIAQPKLISMLMICPALNDYAVTLATMLTLKLTLDSHDAAAGTYTVVTPKAFYTNLIRVKMTDVSTRETKQAQNAYQIDFVQPLLTQEQAASAQSSLMSKLSAGTQIDGTPTWSGLSTSAGQPTSLGAVTAPTSQSLPASSTIGLPTPPIPPVGGGVLST